ncbi:MAG: metallophosphoesterase, partial [Clostridia bacterium]|nr:metallophosphoesterase [Clostridia bacterium]
MTVTRTDYSVPAGGRLSEEVRLAFLSDLHGEDYGPGQAPLFEILNSFSPHAVLIGGDAYDERRPWTKTSETIRLCAERRPTFYTPGNHEAETKKLNECCADAEANGAVLLLGTSSLLEIGNSGDRILLCGAGDPRRRAEGY